MKKLVAALCLGGLACLAFGQEVVEKIEIVGNERVSRDAVLYYLRVREGGIYDEAGLRRDFRVLWSTGFFSNITIESERGTTGRVVRITVEENPVVKDIAFRTGKRLKESDIINKLKEKDEFILPYSYFSPSRIERIKGTIEALLADKGLTDGSINAVVTKKGPHEVGVTFRIKEGLRAKVGEVIFAGNTGVQRDVLAGAMKDNKKYDFLTWLAGKDTYKENKLDQDLTSIRTKLQQYGYMEANVGEPRVGDTTRTTIFLKKQRMKSITIPVQAGERYSVGEVTVEGNKLISTRALRSMIKFKGGEWYSSKVREKAIEKIIELYRNAGHIYAQVVPVESLDPVRKRVGVVFNISEGEAAYLNRLEFKGNVFTKDKVMRREMLLREGDRFSLALFKDSLLRLKQLGIVDVDKEPDVRPGAEDLSKVDVGVNVKELQRNNLQFSAGYSGYEGTFIAGEYSTVNLLGTGESLQLMAQYGKRIKNYSLGFTEPYVLDMPVSAGFTIYNRYIYYPYLFSQQSRGMNVTLGFRVRGFWRTNLTYGFEYLDVGPATDEGSATSSYFNPYYYGGIYGYGKYHVGSLTTSLFRNTVDSPLTPTSGTLYLVGCKFAGGPLGGDIALIKPQFELTHHRRVVGRAVLGLHLSYEFIKPTGSSGIPFWERFYLGGERSVRGYEIYTIGPQSAEGINKGGEKALVMNAEYNIAVGGPLYAIFFFDAGNAFSRHERVRLDNLYTSTGLEFRIFVPALRVPFRLIFAYNNRTLQLEPSHFAFRFAIGTTF
jgi:outer membrane protein insertion porin family